MLFTFLLVFWALIVIKKEITLQFLGESPDLCMARILHFQQATDLKIYNKLTILGNSESKLDASYIKVTELKNTLELCTTAICVASTTLQKPSTIQSIHPV